jgi:autotransporter-associated beta strand protein
VALFANGAGAGSPTSTQDLSLIGAGATLAHGQTLILKNSGAALTLPAGVVAYNSGIANFNGDDALALQSLDGSVNYDIFGVIGNDPGTAWTAGGLSTLDQTLTRDSDVLFGVTVNPSGTGSGAFTTLGTEWTGSPIDTVSNLGSHTMNLQTGSGTIGSTVAGANVTYSGALSAAGATTLTAAAGGTTTFSGIVSGAGTVTKTGAGTVTLSGASANTFTNMTTVSAGTLQLNKTAGTDALAGDVTVNSGAFLLISQSHQVNNNADVTLSGGTITRGAGVNEAFASLNLTTGSFLDFGTGATGSMTFGTYEENTTPSALLTINNFLPGNSFTFSNAQFAGNGSNIAAYFTFGTGFQGRSISDLGGGSFTITAIPEPSTYLAAAGLLSLMLWPSRKRIIRDTKKILGFTPPMRDRLARRASEG